MVGKKWLKLIKSLHQKKYRNQYQFFFVEGRKAVEELIGANLEVIGLFVYMEFKDVFQAFPVQVISPKDLKFISALKNPNGVLGVFKIPQPSQINNTDWIVALDDVRDPGNLGTIIRLCDWFGITDLVCSEATVDVYNPKVIQATMGSIARVNVVYTSLPDFLRNTELPTYGGYMNGSIVYHEKLPDAGILVMGNEANGISPDLNDLTKNQITIPQYGPSSAESLNVAMATGILLSEIRRK
ncbi:MAG: RNA methyltransferase [Bacteroidota bacterium]